MNDLRQPIKPFYHTIWFAISIIGVFFVVGWWPALRDLHAVNFTGGDGGKNLFAFLDYVLYGKGLMAYGMNYPFGEHITFTDNQPPFAIVTKFIHEHITPLDKSLLTIFNFWILFQIPLGAIAFYCLLRNVLQQPLFALIGALLILYLSPQLVRLYTHFSLGYIFCYGFIFNSLWQIIENKRLLLHSILLTFFIFIAGFSHLYNFISVFLFAGFLIIVGFFTRFVSWQKAFHIGLPFAIAAAAILYLVQGLDPFAFRPSFSDGMFDYSGTFEGTFYPSFGKEGEWFRNLAKTNYLPNWESRMFLGFIPILINLIFLTSYSFRSSFRTQLSKKILLFWVSSFFLWLYSIEFFFFPFDREFIETLPFISHFRSIARFGIVFYYMVGVTSVYMLMVLWQPNKMKLRILCIILFLLWGLESYFFQGSMIGEGQVKFEGAIYEKNIFNTPEVLAKYERKIDDYQAILILPQSSSCHFGSEQGGGYFAVHYGSRIRLESGLPVITSVSTRGSIDHGIGVNQLLSVYPSEKRLLRHLNQKKILIHYPSNPEELSALDLRFLTFATKLGPAVDGLFAEISVQDLANMRVPFTPEQVKEEKACQVKMYKKKRKDKEFELAQYERKNDQNGFKIKLKTEVSPDKKIAWYWVLLLDKQNNVIKKIPLDFNFCDFEGFYNIREVILTQSDLGNAPKMILMTNLEKEVSKELSIIPLKVK